jgi:hypothetical protein
MPRQDTARGSPIAGRRSQSLECTLSSVAHTKHNAPQRIREILSRLSRRSSREDELAAFVVLAELHWGGHVHAARWFVSIHDATATAAVATAAIAITSTKNRLHLFRNR